VHKRVRSHDQRDWVAIANRRVQRGRRIPVSYANGLTQRDSNGNCDADSNCYGNSNSHSYGDSYSYSDGNGNCDCGAEVYAVAEASSHTAAETVVSLETVL